MRLVAPAPARSQRSRGALLPLPAAPSIRRRRRLPVRPTTPPRCTGICTACRTGSPAPVAPASPSAASMSSTTAPSPRSRPHPLPTGTPPCPSTADRPPRHAAGPARCGARRPPSPRSAGMVSGAARQPTRSNAPRCLGILVWCAVRRARWRRLPARPSTSARSYGLDRLDPGTPSPRLRAEPCRRAARRPPTSRRATTLRRLFAPQHPPPSGCAASSRRHGAGARRAAAPAGPGRPRLRERLALLVAAMRPGATTAAARPAQVRRPAQSPCVEDIDGAPLAPSTAPVPAPGLREWIDRHKALLTGPTGVGKTWLAAPRPQGRRATHRALPRCRGCSKRSAWRAAAWRTPACSRAAASSFWSSTTGLTRSRPAAARPAGILRPHGRSSTIVTSQVPVEQWHEVIGSPTLADAILDRLVHNAHRIELKGESMRRRAARRATAVDANQEN